ncbi:MAG: HAMP domain-containing histidine kinase, partial [Proteobacteria bacterium]|nr:HAMP domain-containing histidine kinase [Pseudomonadota bacterium]
NVDRLLDLQAKIDDILNQRSVEEKERIISIIEDAASFVEELKEEEHSQNTEILKHISKRIESLFSIEEIHMEKILLNGFLDDICNEAITSIKGRDLNIIRNFEKGIHITMDRNILKKVFLGLLKNAIENTPDEGKIEVTIQSEGNEIRIDIHDYGVGITSQNQKMIFGGFFHTQDTELYSSKRPYEF